MIGTSSNAGVQHRRDLSAPIHGADRGRVGWLFGLTHGHCTQFLNFQESYPEERAGHVEWIGLEYSTVSGDALSRIPIVPVGLRIRRGVRWQAGSALAAHEDWEALVYAIVQRSLLPLLTRHASYLYVDHTPSLKREQSPWYDDRWDRSPVLRALRKRHHTRLFRASRGVFAMSEWAARGIRSDYGVPGERIHVTLPGANLRRWRFVDRSHREAGRPVRILMVGGQFLRKGGAALLEWAEGAPADGWEMDIVTWPSELPEWIRRRLNNPRPDDHASTSLGPRFPTVRVHCGLRPNMTELQALFTAADIFCLPTMGDCSSIASLEAMATGLPVLVGAVGGIPELIEDGLTGFLVRPGDRRDLDAKLRALIGDPGLRLRVGREARRACEDRLNVERQLREILAVIDRDAS